MSDNGWQVEGGLSFIAYAVIAFHKKILVEVETPLKERLPDYVADIEKCPRYVRKVIERLDLDTMSLTTKKKTFFNDSFNFNYVIKSNMIFMCVSEKDHPQKASFAFLRDLRIAWKEAFPVLDYTNMYSLQPQTTFGPVVAKKMLYYSAGDTRIAELQGKVEDIKVTMLDNIKKVFQRQDALESVEKKALDLSEKAPIFAKTTKKMKFKKWKKNKVVTIIFLVCALLLCCCVCFSLIWLILGLACGGVLLPDCVELFKN